MLNYSSRFYQGIGEGILSYLKDILGGGLFPHQQKRVGAGFCQGGLSGYQLQAKLVDLDLVLLECIINAMPSDFDFNVLNFPFLDGDFCTVLLIVYTFHNI